MIWTDPIVEEVRRVRDEYAARFNYDLQAIFLDLKEKEKQGGRTVVRCPKKTDSDAADRVPISNSALPVDESLAEALGVTVEQARQRMEARRPELHAKGE